MSSKGAYSRIAVAKHVYLRTQQRRLRHVKSIIIRNLLSELEDCRTDPLNISAYFTIHPHYNMDKVLYRSDAISQTYNPSWESVQFTHIEIGKHSSLSVFILKLWVESLKDGHSPFPTPVTSDERNMKVRSIEKVDSREEEKGKEEEKKCLLVFEKTIDLSDLVYLGTMVNKDGSGYPSNSVTFGMFEGYYSEVEVGGVQATPTIIHSLADLLPPHSLLEVPRNEVLDSYVNVVLLRILNRQEVLNGATLKANNSKSKVQEYLKEQEDYFRKKRERESLKMRIALLQREIKREEKLEKEESESLSKQRETLDSVDSSLRDKEENLKQAIAQYQVDLHGHHQRMDMLVRARKSQTLRQRNMIYELSQTFFIKEVKDAFTICNVILPNSDQLDQNSNMDQFGVALGYTAHLVSHISRILFIPLQYPIKPNGSRSTISDHISEEAIIDTIKEFPLFLRGSEKALFLYGLHLLNKDIGQIRQHCGYGGSRGMLKKTLPNLKYLLDELIKDFFLSTKSNQNPPNLRSSFIASSQPIDTTSLLNTTPPDRRRSLTGMNASSQDSSLTTTSLTPPTTLSSIVAVDHENFHIGIPVPTSRQHVDRVVSQGEGLEGYDREAGLDGGINGDLDDFGIGSFRLRSNHIAGSYPIKLLPDSVRSSSHEQLHYDASSESTGKEFQRISSLRLGRQEKLRDQSKFDIADQEASTQYPSTNSNLPLVTQACSEDVSPTPTPPSGSSYQERHPIEGYSPYRQNSDSSKMQLRDTEHNLAHYSGQNARRVRETSPAGAGLFVSSENTEEASSFSDAGVVPYLLISDSQDQTGTENGNREIDMLKDEQGHLGSSPAGDSVTVCLNDHSTELCDLEVESNMDFPNRRRSSKLVDPSDIQVRRALTESKVHNLPPEELLQSNDYLEHLSQDSGSIYFTASGFSKLSPSDAETRSVSPGYTEGNLTPQAFVQQSFSPSDGKLCSSLEKKAPPASSDLSLVLSHNSSTRSRDSSLRYLCDDLSRSFDSTSKSCDSVFRIHVSPKSISVEGKDVYNNQESLLTKSPYKLKSTNLADVDSSPSKDQLSNLSQSPLISNDRGSKSNTTAWHHSPSSPSRLPTKSSSRPVSFDAVFQRSPRMLRATVATPHVLGATVEPHVNSNNWFEIGTQSQLRTNQASVEGDNQFLEDFIDGF